MVETLIYENPLTEEEPSSNSSPAWKNNKVNRTTLRPHSATAVELAADESDPLIRCVPLLISRNHREGGGGIWQRHKISSGTL